MHTKQPNTIDPIVGDHVSTSEDGPSRCDIPVQGSRIAGVTTEVCVRSTLRSAVNLDYRCITVSNACASGDPTLHRAALAMIGVEGGIFGEVVTTAQVLE